jgi:uncharacterized GH25 family protein
VFFQGQPIKEAAVILYVKTINGNVFTQKLTTDNSGLIFFKLSREGIYMLSSVHIETSKDKNADFESWGATLTFAFTNNGTMPDTYREFGFGNKH